MQKKNDKATPRLQIVIPDQKLVQPTNVQRNENLSILEYSRKLRRAVEVSVNGKEIIYIYFLTFYFFTFPIYFLVNI